MNKRLMSLLMRSALTRKAGPKVGLASLKVKQVSPELYLAGGIAAGIASTVLFARAYKKQDQALALSKDKIRNARQYVEDQQEEGVEWTREEEARLIAPLYGEAAVKMVRLYAPPVLMGTTALFLILRSHGVMKGRNQALLATLQVVEGAFSKYRSRVIEDQGEDADAKYFFGAEERTVVTETVGEDGKKTKTKAKHLSMGETPTPEIYAREFDETNQNWRESRLINQHYLEATQLFLNHMLNAYGFVFLNDAYDALNLPRNTEYGAVVGWSLDVPGDDFIDFGLDKPINQNPTDPRFMLDFNVNGVILG